MYDVWYLSYDGTTRRPGVHEDVHIEVQCGELNDHLTRTSNSAGNTTAIDCRQLKIQPQPRPVPTTEAAAALIAGRYECGQSAEREAENSGVHPSRLSSLRGDFPPGKGESPNFKQGVCSLPPAYSTCQCTHAVQMLSRYAGEGGKLNPTEIDDPK